MSRFHSYLNSAMEILHLYQGGEPFSVFLKKYFAPRKKFGSRDRKQISHLCYCFFRMGKTILNVSTEEKMLMALFICSSQPNEILAALKPEWERQIQLPVPAKIALINAGMVTESIFPWQSALSDGIDHEEFSFSFFHQPDLFIRLRPGYEKKVKQKLQGSGIAYRVFSDSCIVLPNASRMDGVLELDKEAVIQDYSSQQTGELIKSAMGEMKPKIKVWDACAGSGGKSLMVYDLNPGIELTVSDVRESILFNLEKRFKTAGIKKYKQFVSDLTGTFSPPESGYELIIADVPCTGSGTWSRTPEQLYFFDDNKIPAYAEWQKKIVSNLVTHLKPGGIFIYITCSVFKKENEEMVEYIRSKYRLHLRKMELLKGYDRKADTMFAASFSVSAP